MLGGMALGSRGRRSSTRSGGLLPLVLTVALVGGAFAYSHAKADASHPGGMIILYGDSLSAEASPYFADELARTTTALVIPNIPAPVERNEFARDPVVKDVRPNGPSITDLLGVPEVIIPAGYNQIVYEAKYQLSADKTTYTQVPGTEASLMERPMPISVMFWGGPGDEPRVLKVASAYEAATHHRAPPPGFGPLPGEP